MSDSATIIAASLDSSQLETSINNLVKTVAEKTKAMADNFTSEVARMEQAVKNLGNIKIDSGGASDGGSSRRTKSLSEEIAKAKEVTMSYDQMQAALQKIAKDNGGLKDIRTFNKGELQSYIDLLRKLQAEYVRVNTQEGGGAKSDQIKRDMAELEKIIQGYQTILKNVEMINSRQGTIDVKKWTQDIGAVDDRYKKLVRWYTVLEKEDQRRIANEEKANQKRLAELEKEQNARQKMIESARKAEEKYQNAVLKTAFNKIVDLPSNNIDQMRTKLERLQTILANIRELGILSPKEIANAETEIGKLRGNIQQIEKLEKERIAAEKQFIVEQAKEIEQTETLEGRVRGLAKAAREYFKANNGDVLSTSAYGKSLTIYGENDPRSRGLSIEQQIRNALTEEKSAREGVSQAVQQQQKETQNLNQAQKQESENIKKSFKDYDSLRQAIASVLGVRSENVRLQGVEISSINDLSNRLKELRSVYNQLGTQDRHSERGKELISQIQNIERQMDRARKELSRPIDLKSALGTSEKTLDDIAYKMQRLASYRSGLNVDAQKEEINTVNREYERLKKKMDEVMQKNQQMIGSNNALGRSWNYMKNRLAFYFTVGAGTQFIKNLIEVRSQYEMNERALGILINSAERGTQIFNELSQMALVSPYTLIELSAAAKQLTAYDIAARDVVDTTRRLADMASAVGVPIERLTYALGQIKAYGYLNSRDARMFANAGIPLVKQLSDYYTELEGKMVSTADVYDRMKKKAIDYNSVMSVIYKMTDEGGKFFDFQAKMADTLKVRLANLTLAWNNMLNDMGKETQGVLTFSIGALRNLFLHWKQLDALIRDAAWILGVRTGLMLIFYAALKAGGALGITTRQMALSSVVGKRLAGVLRTLGQSIATIAKSRLTWFSLLALAAWDIFDAFMNADKATIEFNKSLRDSAKTTYEDLKKFAEQYKNVRDSLYKSETIKDASGKQTIATTPQNIEEGEAKKVWEAMREQIELSSHASDEYISKLLSIENVSERLRQGFQMIDNIQAVSAALKEIGEDGIKVEQGWSAWWNAYQLPDGLIGNIKDVANAEKELIENYGSVEAAKQRGSKLYSDYEKRELENFREDLKVTTDSVINFINLNGWSGDTGKIDEMFKQVTDKLATQGNLDPQTAFTLQREIEVARAKAAKEALEIRIADEKNALATASDEISKQQIQKNLETLEQQKRDFDKFNGENRAYWNDFTKYIKERHISELTAAYNSMTDNGKKAMDFQSEEWQKHVHDWANRYEKSHNLATDSVFNRLRNWINDANTWSVFIKMTISTEDGKSIYKQLEEYDNAANDAYKKMQRLDKRIDQLRKKGAKAVEGAETGIDTSRMSEDDKELTDALKERKQAQEDYNKAVEKGGESKKENAAASKAQKAAESELAKALKDELKLIETVRSSYKDLTKDGASHADAVEKSVSGYEKSVANINKVLEKYGIKLDLTKFAGITNPHELQEMFKQQLNALAGKAKPTDIQAMEVELKKVDLDVEKYDLTKITKGLNNELDRLKDEYELAVSLDADPELGSMFADWMGIDIDDLPRTASEYAKRYTDILNKKLKEYNANIELPNLLNITDDNLRELQNRVGTGGITQKYVDDITNGVKAVREVFRKEKEDTSRDWNALIEKYGGLQAKLLKIYKDNVQQQASIVREFGTNDEQTKALDLISKIKISQDPAEIARLQEELAKVMNDVTSRNPVALKTYQAVRNEQESQTGKAYWEDFKNSDLYSMTFTDMANNSTQAIQMIIDKLNELKDKVKEDPASMKALIKSLEDAEGELMSRDPFAGIANSIKTWREATKEQKDAQEELKQANIEVAGSEVALKNAQSVGDKEGIAKAEQKLAQAQQKQATAQEKVVKSGNKAKEAQEQLKNSLQNLSNELGNVSGLLGSVSQIFRAVGDDDTADAIDAINQGFTIMTTVISAVTAALVILQSSNPWLLAMAAALSVIVGLVSFLSGNSNKKITEQVEASERAVKRLELAYVDLQQAVDKAYGTATIGAKQATLANKELQLAEIQRQIQLEKSRTGKNRDEDKIIDLQKQYKELFYEIKNGYTEIVDDLMGTDVASFAENLVSSMIDAFKQGEDYMKVFSDKFDEMIDNMIMKSIVSRVVSQYLDAVWSDLDKRINERTNEESDELAKAQNRATEVRNMSDDEIKKALAIEQGAKWYGFSGIDTRGVTQEMIDKYRKAAQDEYEAAQKRLDAASAFTDSDVDYVMGRVTEVMPELGEKLQNILGQYYKFGESSETQLSALQQGIQGITEDTAGALEGYMNGVSQQVYYQSDLMTQIRDAVVGFSLDVQVATMSQILLQLRSSYEVQSAIHSVLEGWSSPNGMSVRVEMV